jgi:DNA recombination protein RmuC
MDSSTLVALLAVLVVGVALGTALGWALGTLRAREHDCAGTADLEARVADHAVVKEGLDRLHDQLRDLEHQRVAWQSQLRQHVDDVRRSTESLRRETASLATALRRPQVRGRWGELHLRRAVELAGMVERCDFDEQVTATGSDGVVRPDLVVHLAGGKDVVIDAKVPLDAFLDATAAEDDKARAHHLRRHARQLRQHVETLAGKAYWRALPTAPEFVVLFVPGEAFLSAALEGDGTLLEHAAGKRVVLATPTTLIALLRTVAHAWTQQSLTESAQELHRLGVELHERLGTWGGHLDRVGRSLSAAVTAYNKAVGSLETRVLVSARRFADLETGSSAVPAPAPVTEAVRPLGAAELLEAVAEPRPELPLPGDHGDTTPARPTRRAG